MVFTRGVFQDLLAFSLGRASLSAVQAKERAQITLSRIR
jgi:hypothetical protein